LTAGLPRSVETCGQRRGHGRETSLFWHGLFWHGLLTVPVR